MKVRIRLELLGESEGEVVASLPLKDLSGSELLPILSDLKKYLPSETFSSIFTPLQLQQAAQANAPQGAAGILGSLGGMKW